MPYTGSVYSHIPWIQVNGMQAFSWGLPWLAQFMCTDLGVPSIQRVCATKMHPAAASARGAEEVACQNQVGKVEEHRQTLPSDWHLSLNQLVGGG